MTLYLASLAVFAFGALTFSTLALFYWRQHRQERPAAGSVFPVFTATCALAFLINLALQADARLTPLTVLLDLLTGILPPMLLHLVCEQEEGPRWLVRAFYFVGAAVAFAIAAGDAGLLPDTLIDSLENAPAIILGAAGCLGIIVQSLSRRTVNAAERRHRLYTRILLCLMLASAVASILQLNPVFTLLPDYLLLAFFAVTLYYRERLIFFDVLLKRGTFLALVLILIVPLLTYGAGHPAVPALLLLTAWIAAPWVYARLGDAIDRVWLRRPYSLAEAERKFAAAIQAADSEDDLRARAAQALTEIFEAPAEIRFDAAPAPAAAALVNPLGADGWIALGTRRDALPYLSGDRSLLQSLARTLAVVLENVRFRQQEQQLRLLASRAELKALRAQINPHFLFNALNAIAGLIATQPRLAEETVEQLAEVFRYTLRKSENEWVRLDEEMEFVAAYLQVEQSRYGARLAVTLRVDPAAGAIQVPAMSVQPVVENAVKHGAATVEGQGAVCVVVRLEDDALCIDVVDNGPGFPAGFSLAAPGEGHGLRNIAERFRGYYGDAARLAWERTPEGTRVSLRIPRSLCVS